MVVHLLLVKFFIVIVTGFVFSAEMLDVPKESYETFQSFLLSQNKESVSKIKSPSNWIRLKFTSPIIAKYQIDNYTTLAISTFTGSIGDSLSNVNRWRNQLNLPSINELGATLTTYALNDRPVKKVRINNSKQYYLIYWLTINDRHIFNKFVSSQPLDDGYFDDFIESQSWESI